MLVVRSSLQDTQSPTVCTYDTFNRLRPSFCSNVLLFFGGGAQLFRVRRVGAGEGSHVPSAADGPCGTHPAGVPGGAERGADRPAQLDEGTTARSAGQERCGLKVDSGETARHFPVSVMHVAFDSEKNPAELV